MPRQFGGLFSNARVMPACWRKAPGLCGVSLPAVSYSPTVARHASPYESGQSLRPERLDAPTRAWRLGFNSSTQRGASTLQGEGCLRVFI